MGPISSGKAKADAVTATQRVPELPDLPTLDEVGLDGLETIVWLGLFAPKGTPDEVEGKVGEALHAARQDQEVITRLADLARPDDA